MPAIRATSRPQVLREDRLSSRSARRSVAVESSPAGAPGPGSWTSGEQVAVARPGPLSQAVTPAALPKPAMRSTRPATPFLALSAINVWTDRTTADYYALSTALCLCGCAVGNGAAWICPNAAAAVTAPSLTWHSRSRWGGDPQCPRAVSAPERVVARRHSRLRDDGIPAFVTDGAAPVIGSRSPASDSAWADAV